MTTFKKTILAATAALTLGATVAATTTPGGGAVARAGSAAATVTAAAESPPGCSVAWRSAPLPAARPVMVTAYPGYGYAGYAPAYGYGNCRYRRQAVVDPYGNFLGYRRVQVCLLESIPLCRTLPRHSGAAQPDPEPGHVTRRRI